MRGFFASLILESIGAFAFWMLNGFKGEFKSYLSHDDEKKKGLKNNAMAIIILILLFIIYTVAFKIAPTKK